MPLTTTTTTTTTTRSVNLDNYTVNLDNYTVNLDNYTPNNHPKPHITHNRNVVRP